MSHEPSFDRCLRIAISDEALGTRTGQLIAVTATTLAARLTSRIDFAVGRAEVSGGVAVLLGSSVIDAESLTRLACSSFPVTCSTDDLAPVTVTLGVGRAGNVSVGVGVHESGAAVVKAGQPVDVGAGDAPIAALIAAAIGVTQAAKLLYPGWLGSIDDVVTVGHGPFGAELDSASPRIVGRPIVAGVGALGCALVYALVASEATGELILLDPDSVGDENLARYVLYTEDHISKRKVDVAAGFLAAVGIDTEVHALTFADYLKEDLTRRDGAIEVLTLVDSYGQRRAIARDLPKAILNAGTSDRDFTVSRHGFGDGFTCLGCQYPEPELDVSVDAVMARALGMDIEVVSELRLSKRPLKLEDVRSIARARGDEPAALDDYVDRPLDSLYNRLCSITAIRTANAGEVFAPIAYLSALAGFMLAAGLLGQERGARYLRMDVFNGLAHPRSTSMGRRRDCDICGLPALVDAYRARWGSLGA